MQERLLDTSRGRFGLLHQQPPGDAARWRVLALHGWLDNAASFLPLAGCLPELELVALDLAGHGHSVHRPTGSWYYLPDYLEDVAAVLDALGWERCVLLGHSLGGAVATMYAAAAPQQVQRLVGVEALGPLPFQPGSAATALADALAARRRHAPERMRVYPDPDAAVQARMQANGLSETAARTLVQRALQPVPGGWAWRSDPRLRAPTAQRAHEQQILEWIAAITAPTLVVTAEPATPGLDPQLRDRRFAQLRDGHHVALPGNHHLHLEDPQPVADAVRAFLSDT